MDGPDFDDPGSDGPGFDGPDFDGPGSDGAAADTLLFLFTNSKSDQYSPPLPGMQNKSGSIRLGSYDTIGIGIFWQWRSYDGPVFGRTDFSGPDFIHSDRHHSYTGQG